MAEFMVAVTVTEGHRIAFLHFHRQRYNWPQTRVMLNSGCNSASSNLHPPNGLCCLKVPDVLTGYCPFCNEKYISPTSKASRVLQLQFVRSQMLQF